MPQKAYSRKDLIDAFRAENPDAANIPDNKIFVAIAQVDPELVGGISELHQPEYKSPGSSRILEGVNKVSDAVNDFDIGGGKALGSMIQAGGQWLQNITGQKVDAPRMTKTGRDVFTPENAAQRVGNIAGKIGIGAAGAMAGGPTLVVRLDSEVLLLIPRLLPAPQA